MHRYQSPALVGIDAVLTVRQTSSVNTYGQICVARLLTGLGVGATSGLVPVFQAEASPPRFRGLVTGSFQLCVTMGIWGVSMTNWGMSSYSGDVR
jgi:SP family sugar:H+ symporter-like MFS transporter